jgi:hypothetical protein
VSEYASVLDRLTEGRRLPKGCDTWGFKSVRPDGRTRGDFTWPLTAKWVEATGPFHSHTGACPRAEGDGLCVATTYAGMASGGIPARTMLLTAHSSSDVLGSEPSSGKLRVRRVRIVAVLDGERVLREHGSRADLSRANLSGAYLSGAYLSGADLSRAYLSRAYLSRADLSRANLSGAYLSGAYLSGAYLSGADLSRANLSRADLSGAYLSRANLSGANLSRAYLSGANLSRAIGYAAVSS